MYYILLALVAGGMTVLYGEFDTENIPQSPPLVVTENSAVSTEKNAANPVVEAPESVEQKKPVSVSTSPSVAPKEQPKEKKKKKGGTKKHDDDDFDFYVPSYTYIPTPPPIKTTKPSAPTVDHAAIAAKKQASCKKIANQCMADIGSKISSFSGSSYSAAAKAYGDTCNRQYRSCLK